jgi:CHASE3 domain sensor protein
MLKKLNLQQKILLGYTLQIIALLGAATWGALSVRSVIQQFRQVNSMADLVDKTHHPYW